MVAHVNGTTPPARVPTIGGQPSSSMTDEDERLPAGGYVLEVAETVDRRDPYACGALAPITK